MNEFGGGFYGDRVVGWNLVLLAEGPFVIFGVNINRGGASGVQVGEGAEVVGMTMRQQIGGDG